MTPFAWAKATASATFIKTSRFSFSGLWSITFDHGVPCTRFIE